MKIMMRSGALIGVLAAAIGTTACVGFEHSGDLTNPSDSSSVIPLPSLVGMWVWEPVDVDAFPNPNSCSNLQWRVTSQTPTSLAGEFAVTCGDGISILGT